MQVLTARCAFRMCWSSPVQRKRAHFFRSLALPLLIDVDWIDVVAPSAPWERRPGTCELARQLKNLACSTAVTSGPRVKIRAMLTSYLIACQG